MKLTVIVIMITLKNYFEKLNKNILLIVFLFSFIILESLGLLYLVKEFTILQSNFEDLSIKYEEQEKKLNLLKDSIIYTNNNLPSTKTMLIIAGGCVCIGLITTFIFGVNPAGITQNFSQISSELMELSLNSSETNTKMLQAITKSLIP